MRLNWFTSRTFRQARQMGKHVQKILNAQRDILSPAAIANMEGALADLRKTLAQAVDKKELLAEMTSLENAANKWLKPYPNAGLRENVEVLLVAIAVAMGIRTFFLQPFKIPTGSMQPTLYGVTSNPDFSRSGFPQDLQPNPDFNIPDPITRFVKFWINGIQYKHVVARAEGALSPDTVDKPTKFLLFNLKQEFWVGNEHYVVWFPPDNLLKRAGLSNFFGQPNPRVFRKGEDIIKIKVTSGDHLFVDRVSYNFRRPTRGEIVVFETKGISALPQDQFYIKRMVAMGGDKVRIGNDRHLVINNVRLDATTPHFENVYSFNPSQPPKESAYSGHVNQFIAHEFGLNLAPLFPDADTVVEVPKNHYMVMGDNTMNSSDSRTWGAFPRENVIGKSFFVYWPIGRQNGRPSRFGWGQQ